MKWPNEKLSENAKKLNIQIIAVIITKAFYYLTSGLKFNFWTTDKTQVYQKTTNDIFKNQFYFQSLPQILLK